MTFKIESDQSSEMLNLFSQGGKAEGWVAGTMDTEIQGALMAGSEEWGTLNKIKFTSSRKDNSSKKRSQFMG